MSLSVKPGTSAAWKELDGGRRVPAVLEDSTVRMLARDVPPMGYRVYVPDRDAPPQQVDHSQPTSELVLSSAAFQVELDAKRGGIASLVDRRSGRELVDQASPYALGQYLYERFSDAQQQQYVETYCKTTAQYTHQFGKQGMPPETPYAAASPRGFRLRWCTDPLGTSVQLSAQASEQVPHAVTLSVHLYRELPYVDVAWSVEGKKPDPWAEAGWLCLPLAVVEPQFRLGRLGSIVNPSHDTAVGCNHDLFCINTGLTVADQGGHGVGICPMDSPLVSLGEPGVYHFNRRFSPRAPTVFVNLFNNAWGTNFQQWIGGGWCSVVRLWATAGKNQHDDLISPSCEARWSCQAAMANGPAGSLPPTAQGIALTRPGTLVTAFGPNPDGNGIVLRLWELAGEDGAAEISAPFRTGEVWSSALRSARPTAWSTVGGARGTIDAPHETIRPLQPSS